MTLFDSIEQDLEKLERRIAKQGFPNVSFMKHESYIRSTLWRKISNWVKERDGQSCCICRSKGDRDSPLEVHHRSYDLDVLEGRSSDKLVTLCQNCHYKIEHYKDRKKRSCLIEKEHELQRLKELHPKIMEEGLPLKIREKEWYGGYRIQISYIGHDEMLEFHKLNPVVYHFVPAIQAKYRDELMLKFPLRHESMRSKSGMKAYRKIDGREIFCVKRYEDEYLIQSNKRCELRISDEIKIYIEEKWNPFFVREFIRG